MRSPVWFLFRRAALSASLFFSLLVVSLLGWFATGPTPEERALVLLERQVETWRDRTLREQSNEALRRFNPEWDFMRRTFLVLALADRALVNPEEKTRWIALIDDVIHRTVEEERIHGQTHFLLPYANGRPWTAMEGRSLFVEGEIALMLGARRFVEDDPALAAAHQERVARIVGQFERAGDGLPESYPDEAWLFCMTTALVAVQMAEGLDGTDHGALIERFVARLPQLVDRPSGLLGSEFTSSAEPLDGPEGSSLWWVTVNLQLLDPAFAREQYAGATEALVHELFGLGWASEWGPGWRGPTDIDSGPIVPLLDASPSSSGFALLASRAFGDDRLHGVLTRSLRAADLLVLLDPRLGDMAANPMGDVILLHGLTHGPLWDAVRRQRHSSR